MLKFHKFEHSPLNVKKGVFKNGLKCSKWVKIFEILTKKAQISQVSTQYPRSY